MQGDGETEGHKQLSNVGIFKTRDREIPRETNKQRHRQMQRDGKTQRHAQLDVVKPRVRERERGRGKDTETEGQRTAGLQIAESR